MHNIFIMTKIEVNDCVYNIHPVYDLYGSDKDGNIIHIIKKTPSKGHHNNKGYMMCMVRKHCQVGQKCMYVHRFVWECFNGIIPGDKVIDHINDDKEDNRLCNLQLLTQQDNCRKSAKKRDYTFVAKNYLNKKCVKAINTTTGEFSYYNSLYAASQHLGINAGIVKMVSEGTNNYKSGVSKKDGCKYVFEYVNEQDMPDNCKKSANIRPRKVLDEYKKKHQLEAVKRWQNKEFICPKCGKILKNSSKYVHNKKCN